MEGIAIGFGGKGDILSEIDYVGGGDGKSGIMARRVGLGIPWRGKKRDDIIRLDSRIPLFVYVRGKALGRFAMDRWMHTAYDQRERMSTTPSSSSSFESGAH